MTEITQGSPMKIGVFDHFDSDGRDLAAQYEWRLALIEAYDRSGIDIYHLAEHHSTALGLAPSPSVFLSAVAQRTKRLRFGPLVYTLPLHHPLRVYEEICMLDQMSGGRLEVGVGRGISPFESTYYGVDPKTRAKRIARVSIS
jgi:alkanesulfonate monooxygenase SsuD/methylene tetrahydromethanopterin reductase-like flavin-dependent oxidoreductase (luciferase family)